MYLLRSLLLQDTVENFNKFRTSNVQYGAMHKEREGLFLMYNFRELDNSKEILEHAKSRPYFVSEYLVGDPLYGEYHMIQLRPDMRVYRKFLASKYSSMYNAKQLEIVSKDKSQRSWYVLRKHKNLLKEFVEKFGLPEEHFNELDSNIDPKIEFFEYPIIDPLEFKNQYNEKSTLS